ncbi:MAG: GDSL-type esterase/lipase family protein [Minicystis sp.]
MKSRREILLRAAVIGVLTLLPLLLVEIGLRLSGFSFHLYPEEIRVGWPNPRIIRDAFLEDPDLYYVRRDYQAILDEGRARRCAVVFMGDSCTDYGTYPDLFGARLASHAPATTWLNVGTGGYSSYQGLRQFERDVVPLRPKIVTFYFGWNDHWRGFGVADKDLVRIDHAWIHRLRRVRLVQLLTRALVGHSARARRSEPIQRVSEEDFRANLTAFARTARHQGITPVLLTAPSAHERGHEPAYLKDTFLPDLGELVPIHERYAGIVREVARAEDAALCDLAAEFQGLPRRDVQERYFKKDGIHLKPAGDEVIARSLERCFAEHGLLDLLRR